MNAIETKISDFLRAAHPSASGSIEESSNLFADGWLDSLLHIKLLVFLEENFHLRISPLQITRKSFLTVRSIAELVIKGGS